MGTDHYFWQYNTDLFLSIRFIQVFYAPISIPEYIKDVVTAFESGTYSLNGLNFREYWYGGVTNTND